MDTEQSSGSPVEPPNILSAILQQEGMASPTRRPSDVDPNFLLCSRCFADHGLQLTSAWFGVGDDSACPNCGVRSGKKLTAEAAEAAAQEFFVRGTFERSEYGGAPRAVFNDSRTTDISVPPWLQRDVELLSATLGIGFFLYGPRLCLLGMIEPLEDLQDDALRDDVIARIVNDYPTATLSPGDLFYRVRRRRETDTWDVEDPHEYDSPPVSSKEHDGGRLASNGLPVMYASPDLDICLHECRVAADDDLFIATLTSTRELRLLDLTEVLLGDKDYVSEFESLDLAVHMLFLARNHSYGISRAIAMAVWAADYDGIVYPSYFSLLRTGERAFETSFGLMHRSLAMYAERERSKTVPNFGLFGHPIAEGRVEARCINRIFLRQVLYDVHFGPISV